MDFKRARPGEPLDIPARDWNRITEAARAYYDGLSGQFAPKAVTSSRPDIVWVRNDIGDDLDCWSVVGISDPLFLPAENAEAFGRPISFKGVVPTIAHCFGASAILIEPVAKDQVGRGVMTGVTAAKIDVTDAKHDYAHIKIGSTDCLASSNSGGGGARIIWKDSGTGIQWAVVQLGVPAESAHGIIVSSSLQAGHKARWNYTIQPARWNAPGTDFEATADPVITAINIIELRHVPEPVANQSWIVWSTEAHMPNITLTPTPLSNGPIDYYTDITPAPGSAGSPAVVIYYFRGWGGFAGSCTSGGGGA